MSQILYIDAPDLISTRSIYTDAALTIKAPDGFYREGTNYRQMANGELLQAQPCPSCDLPPGTYLFYLSTGELNDDAFCLANFVTSTPVYTTDGDGTLASLLNADLYTDAGLTTPFDGGGLYYFASLFSGDSSALYPSMRVIQVDINGFVLQSTNYVCP